MNSKRRAWLFPVFVVATLAAALWLARSIEHAPHAATRTVAAGEFSATRFPAGSPLPAMSVSGQSVLAGKQVTGVRSVRLYGFGRNAVPFEMVVEAGRPLPVVLVDVSALPESELGTVIAAVRPGNAAPWQLGDRAMVYTRVTL